MNILLPNSVRAVVVLILLLPATMLYAGSAPRLHVQPNSITGDVRVSVDFADAPLADVFRDLEQKTGFRFVYDDRDSFLQARVSLRKDNVSLNSVLQAIAQQASVKFKQVNQTIAVTALQQPAKTTTPAAAVVHNDCQP